MLEGLIDTIRQDPAVWSAIISYGGLVIALPWINPMRSEHRYPFVVLTVVWAFLFSVGLSEFAFYHWIAVLTDIAAGAFISVRWRNGVAGMITLMFIPMVLLRGTHMIFEFDPRHMFWMTVSLSFAQLLIPYLGTRFDLVSRMFDHFCSHDWLFDSMVAWLGKRS